MEVEAATGVEAAPVVAAVEVAVAEEAKRTSLPLVRSCRRDGSTLLVAFLCLDVQSPAVGRHDRGCDRRSTVIDLHDDLVTAIRERAVGIRQNIADALNGIVPAVESAAPLHMLNAAAPADEVIDNVKALV